MLVESYIYLRVLYLVESCHGLYFSIVESCVYYEFMKLYLLEVYLKDV